MVQFRQLVVLSATFVVVLAGARPVTAHDLKLKVDTTHDPIRVEAWFTDDSPAEQARITITNESGELVAPGAADDRGVWTFPRPKGGKYKAVAESIGHHEEVEFPIAEIGVLGGEYTGWRMNKWLGMAIGLTLILGGTVLFWFVRRNRSRS